MKNSLIAIAALLGALTAGSANATPFTLTSPTGGVLPSNVSAVGGVVLDLKGANGTRIVSQVAASTEYVGNPTVADLVFGTQTGFTSSVISQLGGGITSLSVRVSLYDGDSQSGNFDFNQNFLRVNGVQIGNFSASATQQTDGTGTVLLSSGFGYGDNIFSTGFFSTTDATQLANIFASLSSGSVKFSLFDLSPGDQFFDFTQGVDSSLINIGSGPVITTPGTVPEPETLALLGLGVLAGGLAARRKTK